MINKQQVPVNRLFVSLLCVLSFRVEVKVEMTQTGAVQMVFRSKVES